MPAGEAKDTTFYNYGFFNAPTLPPSGENRDNPGSAGMPSAGPNRRSLLKLASLSWYPLLFLMCLPLLQCGRTPKLGTGSYAVADQEYSSQNYAMLRHFQSSGTFEEKHELDHCLLMEMTGKWEQEGGTLKLRYDRMRNRASCHDSLPEWARDTSALEIPVRNVEGKSFESLLAASDGKPEKWLKWLKTE